MAFAKDLILHPILSYNILYLDAILYCMFYSGPTLTPLVPASF